MHNNKFCYNCYDKIVLHQINSTYCLFIYPITVSFLLSCFQASIVTWDKANNYLHYIYSYLKYTYRILYDFQSYDYNKIRFYYQIRQKKDKQPHYQINFCPSAVYMRPVPPAAWNMRFSKFAEHVSVQRTKI